MANFKTHLTFSTLMGAAYGGAAYGMYGVPLPTCVLTGGVCALSGMLPDMDSGPGVPLRESMAFAAAVVPMMMLGHFQAIGLSHESMILAAAGLYLLIRFGLAELLRRYTVHRGMFHSIPAAVIAAEIAFLLASGEVGIRVYKAGGVLLGYLSHLVLDELFSIQWRRGRLRLKNTFGTALKLFTPNKLWPNVSAFAKLGVLTYLVIYEPGWVDQMRERHRAAHPDSPATASAPEETAKSQPAAGATDSENPAAELGSRAERLWNQWLR